MSAQGQIIIATHYSPEATAALQVWGRRALMPAWMRVAQVVGSCVLGISSAAGILFLTQIVLYEIDPQLVDGAWRLFPLVAFAGLLFVWSRAQRFQTVRLSRPLGDGAERYRFHAQGFESETEGAICKHDWRTVGDLGSRRDVLFLRTGTELHAVNLAEISDKAQRVDLVARVRALWLAGRG